MERPNILFVVFDTARADSTALHGGPPTPAMTDLAASGTSADHAVAPSCWTLPSHLSMFTGLLPRTAGVATGAEAEAGWGPIVRQHAERALPSVLAANGWATMGLSANPWISEPLGFDAGFDEFRLTSVKRQTRLGSGSWRTRIAWIIEALRARTDDGAREIEQRIHTWMHDRSRQPFFWFVNLTECHSPYLPPLPWNDFGPVDRVRAALDAREWQSFAGIAKTCLAGPPPPDAALERMRHLYQQSVAMMDAWLARVLERMDSAGILDETIVIVTSDHGENFGEQGLIGHAFSLDNRLLHVPLVVAGPGVDDDTIRDDGAFSLVDLPAVVAGLAGLTDHPYHAPSDSGVAVAQLDAPSRDEKRVTDALVALGFDADHDARVRLTTRETCASNGRRKLLRTAGTDSLVDLDDDPLEERPRRVTREDEAHFHAELGQLRRALDRAETAEDEHDHSEVGDPELDPDLADRLRLLGYL